jgi:hypothetical protein
MFHFPEDAEKLESDLSSTDLSNNVVSSPPSNGGEIVLVSILVLERLGGKLPRYVSLKSIEYVPISRFSRTQSSRVFQARSPGNIQRCRSIWSGPYRHTMEQYFRGSRYP